MIGLRRALATKVIDPIVWKLKRMPVGARLEQFRAEQWDDAETVERRQADRLRGLLAHAVTRVPFYRERVAGLTAADIEADPWGSLAAFPILEKEDVRHHLDDLTCDMGRGKMIERTGGSTGLPLVFYRDRYSQAASFASTQLFYDWAGVERGERRIRIWGSPRDFAAQRSPVMRFLNFFHDRTLLDAFAMGDAQMREYIRFLHKRPPSRSSAIGTTGFTSTGRRPWRNSSIGTTGPRPSVSSASSSSRSSGSTRCRSSAIGPATRPS